MTASQMPRKPGGKVLVIGSGIIGVSVANYLLKAGFGVDVVDPAIPGSEEQCSYGNAGGICPGSCIPNSMPGVLGNVPKWLMDPEGPLHVRLAYLPHALPWLLRFLAASRKSRVEEISAAMRSLHRFTFECYEPLIKEAGCEELLQKRGQLFVHESAEGAASGAYGLDLRRRHGVRVEILNQGEIQDLEPALAPIFKSAVYLPDQGQCPNPGRLVAKLAELATRNGARFHRARVASFEKVNGRVVGVRLEDGTVMKADQFVIAAGAWSTELSSQLGDRIPFESERGYHVMVKGADTGLKIQTISADKKFVLSPMEEGLRIAGNVEFSGLRKPPNMHRADALLKHARPMFRKFEVGEVSRWMGHRPGTPDSIPVIDRAGSADNVIYAFGHGHQGLIAGAVTGKVVSEMASGQPSSVDLTPFRRDRF